MKIKNSNPAFESLDRNKLERMLEILQKITGSYNFFKTANL